MSSFFSKLQNTGKHIFQKAQGASNHFFSKTIPSVSQGLDYISDKSKEYGRKIGNTLERDVGNLSDIASGALMLAGQPQYAALANTFGNSVRALGKNIKKGSKSISNVSNDLNNSVVKNGSNVFL